MVLIRPDETVENLSLIASITIKLCEESLKNDKRRFLACFRPPSKITRGLKRDLLYVKLNVKNKVLALEEETKELLKRQFEAKEEGLSETPVVPKLHSAVEWSKMEENGK